MTVKLLTEHHLEFLSLKGAAEACQVYTCQNATLLEISCRGPIAILERLSVLLQKMTSVNGASLGKRKWQFFGPDSCYPRVYHCNSMQILN